MCCTRLAGNAGCKNRQKFGIWAPCIAQLCRAISSQLRHVMTIGKNMLNSNISPTCLHNMVNFGPLTAEICWRVSGTPANFNGLRIFASLLQRRHSTEVNQTLHNVWPSPGLVHFPGLLPRNGVLPRANSLCVQVLRCPILAALLHGTRAVGVSESLRRRTRNGIRNFCRGRHLYSAAWAAITLGISPHSSY